MSEIESSWTYLNAASCSVTIWLEPWAEEFEVPSGSAVTFRSADGCALGEVEQAEDHITIWAAANRVEVIIEGVLQESASSQIAIPEGLTKGMLTVMFTGHPEARLGGEPSSAMAQISLWQRLRSFLHI